MLFLERLAEQKILQAMERGEFDNLPGKGKPIPDEDGMERVPEDLRLSFRIMKNAGYIPEEVRLRREIADLSGLLDLVREDQEAQASTRARLNLLIARLGEMCGGNLGMADAYGRRIAEKLGRIAAENSLEK